MGSRSAFVPHTPVRISIEGDPRYIEIKPALNIGERNSLLDVLVKVGALTSASATSVDVMIGRYTTALVEAFVCGWSLPEIDDDGKEITPSPAFDPALVRMLDSTDPLVKKVIDEVTERDPLERKSRRGSTT